MYFTTLVENEIEKIGILNNDRTKVLDLEKISEFKKCKDMYHLIKELDLNKELIKLIKSILNDSVLWEKEAVDIKKAKIIAPIPRLNRNVICLGLNYKDHVAESQSALAMKIEKPELPVFFTKMPSNAVGHEGQINSHPDVTSEVDYEVELALIIGKKGMNIKPEEAEEYIFGYTILNDISARDIQRNHIQWFKGKSLDTFTVMGPYIVHKEAIPFPVELDIYSKVNGELRQNSNTKHFIFDIPYIISELSKGMTLEPGDVIATGTPAGVGMGFKPPKYLRAGDVVECSIEKIGSLINTII